MRLLVTLIALFTGCALLAAQDAVFSSRIEQVRVDALVLENGHAVAGLTRADFDVLDEGVAQHVELQRLDQLPVDVTLALDMSDSVDGARLQRLRAAGRAVLAGLKTGDQAGLVTFSHVVRLGAKLTDRQDVVRAALDQAGGNGDTALVDGTYAGVMVAGSGSGRSLLIVFSDGVDTASWLSADAVIDVAKRSDVTTYALYPRGDRRSSFLRDLTSATAGRLYEIDPSSDVQSIFVAILDEFRHRYLLSFTPQSVSASGWHRLEVRVKGHPRATVVARSGYAAIQSR
jgi:VWFA-related protein